MLLTRTNGHAIILAALLLTGCGKTDDKPEPSPPSDDQRTQFDQAADRMLAMSEPHGWIVSRWPDRIEHTGDALLWTGMAMGVLDCERGGIPEAALAAMLRETGGTVYRHPVESEREPSLDGQLGFLWGIAQRLARCPESHALWKELLPTYKPENVLAPFLVVRDALVSRLALGPAPSLGRRDNLGRLVAAWAGVVNATKKAAFRIHLGLLTLQALEVSDLAVSPSVRNAFCQASNGSGLATTDHYCSRGDLAAWVEAFEFNAWEFHFQRGVWESQDGKAGLETPALDLLVALRTLYDPLPLN